VASLSRALRAIYIKYSANWWFDPGNVQCFVFRAHIFFFFTIFPKIAFIQHLSVRLRLELGSRLFFKCIIFN
jgi:hypothetical protein